DNPDFPEINTSAPPHRRPLDDLDKSAAIPAVLTAPLSRSSPSTPVGPRAFDGTGPRVIGRHTAHLPQPPRHLQ
ncbi:hypothetical protein O4J56_16380, partial [Nocardiopsis sp. RSe5-2]